jgi:hypothetical protein
MADVPESTKTRYEVLGAHTLHLLGEMTTELTQDLEEDAFFIRFRRKPAASPVAPQESVEGWECFQDLAYYDMWAVRPLADKRFEAAFHVSSKGEAEALCAVLNTKGTR